MKNVCLYLAHALATFCERGWAFAVALFILEVFPDTLLPVALYGGVEGLVKTILGSHAGAYVDRTERMSAVMRSFAVLNVGNALSSIMNAFMIFYAVGNQGDLESQVSLGLLVMVILCGSTAAVGNMAAKISLQRDWAKVLYAGDSEALATFNAVMKAIDLSALVVAPVLVGVCMDLLGVVPTALLIPVVYLVAYPVEVLLLRHVYRMNPSLQEARATLGAPREPSEGWGLPKGVRQIATHARLYFAQQCWPPAFCLAMLYFTVLSFSPLMTGYLKWSGMGNTEQSGFRALGALTAMLASLVFPFAMRRTTLPRMGLWGIHSQVLCLLGMVLARFVVPAAMGWGVNQGADATLYIFTTFLALSRFGLWGFDLSVTQILQEQVPMEVVGTVNGVQGSLQDMMQMLMYAVSLLFTNPKYFWILVTAAICNVVLAAVIYTLWLVATPPMEDRPPQLRPGEGDAAVVACTLVEPEDCGGATAAFPPVLPGVKESSTLLALESMAVDSAGPPGDGPDPERELSSQSERASLMQP